mgnify:CR=1 FL=1
MGFQFSHLFGIASTSPPGVRFVIHIRTMHTLYNDTYNTSTKHRFPFPAKRKKRINHHNDKSTSANERTTNGTLLNHRPFQLHCPLDHPLPHCAPVPLPTTTTLPVRIIIIIIIIPLPPLEQPHPRPQHGDHPPRDQADADGAVGVAVERLARIVGVPFQPDVVEGHDLRGFRARFARRDPVPGERDHPLDGDVVGVGG